VTSYILRSALCALLLWGCRERTSTSTSESDARLETRLRSAIAPPAAQAPPRRGMVWISGGALVAGTPPDTLPRIADEESPGEQVVLRGFYIDTYPYPDEEGAIPQTNVSQAEAAGLCAEQGKRLCSELEWERACKGPKNWTYEYGERYRAERCATGAAPALRPSGLRVGCVSEFGVSDMHGGVWEWTSSNWGRGVAKALGTLRGGNASAGELVSRCANAIGRPADSKSGVVGFRCCAGPRNDAEVVLNVDRTTKLKHKERLDKELATQLASSLPAQAKIDLGKRSPFKFDRMWDWWPVGNERLVVAGGCAGRYTDLSCGVVIARVNLGRPTVLGWVGSGHWAPAVQSEGAHREAVVFGGDELGSFRRPVSYVWGSLSVGEKDRRIVKPRKKRDQKNARKRR
jgi:formylglycine-generating enzyme